MSQISFLTRKLHKQSNLTAEQLNIRRVTPFLMTRLNCHNCYLLCVISLSYTTLMLYLDHNSLFSLSYNSQLGSNIIFFPCKDFFTSHPDSPFVGASDIGQEPTYTSKLQELPTGTSQRSSAHCLEQRQYAKVIICQFLRNNIFKYMLSRYLSQKQL